ncbi:hypothetical protein FWF48_02740 [Candidatus Saccharibacteria bacterium]|nr:hypothetical protein [Candidatus Saccharibacteria bacterium]
MTNAEIPKNHSEEEETASNNKLPEPTDAQKAIMAGEAAPEQQEQLDERLHVDLNTPEYTEKFENAELFVKTSPVMVEEVTAEGLESDAYADKGVTKNASGDYILTTMVVNQHKDAEGQVTRVPEVENTYVLEPGNFIVTNPVWHEGEPLNNFVQKDAEKIAKLYEPVGEGDAMDGYNFGEGKLAGKAMRPKGYSEGTIEPRPVIQNDTDRQVQIDAPWGGTQDGNFDCYFVKSGPNNCYILSQNDFAGYIPNSEYQEK